MDRILQYRMYVSVVVLSVFALASSGFTTILHECRMQQELTCCSMPENMNEDECETAFAPTSGHSFESGQSCYTNSIIGGLAVKQGVLDKDKSGKLQRTGTSVASISSAISFSPSNSNRFDSRPGALFLPPVGKYILNSSLLI